MIEPTAIFWFVEGKMIWDFEDVEFGDKDEYVNQPYSHFEMWDKRACKGLKGDFPTYPWGRVIYNNFAKNYKNFQR